MYLIIFSTDSLKAKNYIIENIEIIEPYDVNFKKKTVIDKAFISAFDLLISKIVTSNELKKTKNIELSRIKSMVDSFSITNEKFIENKYSTKIDVLFEKKKVLNYFYEKNITPSILLEKKIVFLPILIDLDKNNLSIYLDNKFYLYWNNLTNKSNLLSYTLPSEDLEEFDIINNNLENIENYEFKKLLSKYNKDFIVAIFFQNKKNINVLSKINFNNKLTIINSQFENINIDNVETTSKVIEALKTKYENFWKKENLINISIKLPLTVSIDSNNLKLLSRFDEVLDNSDLVYDYYIESFTKNETIFKIIYNSTPNKFINNFEEQNFEIDYNGEVWKIK